MATEVFTVESNLATPMIKSVDFCHIKSAMRLPCVATISLPLLGTYGGTHFRSHHPGGFPTSLPGFHLQLGGAGCGTDKPPGSDAGACKSTGPCYLGMQAVCRDHQLPVEARVLQGGTSQPLQGGPARE